VAERCPYNTASLTFELLCIGEKRAEGEEGKRKGGGRKCVFVGGDIFVMP
jgi:hypothetical protein